jgi:hypothetical protein
VIVTAREFFLVQPDENAFGDGFFREQLVFRSGTIAPENLVGPTESDLFLDPCLERLVRRVAPA